MAATLGGHPARKKTAERSRRPAAVARGPACLPQRLRAAARRVPPDAVAWRVVLAVAVRVAPAVAADLVVRFAFGVATGSISATAAADLRPRVAVAVAVPTIAPSAGEARFRVVVVAAGCWVVLLARVPPDATASLRPVLAADLVRGCVPTAAI